MVWILIPLWLFFAYLYTQILGLAPNGDAPNLFLAAFGLIDFGVHEVSHLVVAFLPQILVAAAGSFGEILLPTTVTILALRAKSYFAASFGMIWMMLAMTDAGIYMADARTMQLRLLGPSPDPIHDWHFVFGQLGWLDADTFIGGAVRGLGDVVGAIGLLLGLWVIARQFAKKPSEA